MDDCLWVYQMRRPISLRIPIDRFRIKTTIFVGFDGDRSAMLGVSSRGDHALLNSTQTRKLARKLFEIADYLAERGL